MLRYQRNLQNRRWVDIAWGNRYGKLAEGKTENGRVGVRANLDAKYSNYGGRVGGRKKKKVCALEVGEMCMFMSQVSGRWS